MKNIAIIGAGLSGLTLAHALKDYGDVHVFEKARGVGGRMSTRYADPFFFDHGAQFFTVRTKMFKHFLRPYLASGLIAHWHGKVITLGQEALTDRIWFEPHYVATPNMNNLCKHLAEEINVRTNIEIAPLRERYADGWHLHDKEGVALGVYNLVISTAPPLQTTRLFGAHLPTDNALHTAKLLACYTLMIGFHRPWDKSWIAAKVQDSPLQWISINNTKPHRNSDVTSIVVHSNNEWAEAHCDDDIQEAEAFLIKEFERVTGINCTHTDYLSTHRWRYAITDGDGEAPPYYDSTQGLAASSDWCNASRVEQVWTNAMQLADRITSAI